MKEKLTIGKLAAASNVGVETIRFYERKGLISQPKKQGGFRYYSSDLIQKIHFIKRSQELGFTLKEAKELIDLKYVTGAKCGDVQKKTQRKIEEIESKIKDLKKIKKSLVELDKCFSQKERLLSDCPVLDCFTVKGKC